MSNNEALIEQELQDKGLNAPRICPADVDSAIVSDTYTILPSGKCMICEITLKNGFTVTGKSSCVSKENFNEEIGRKISYVDAREKIWAFLAYNLQDFLYRQENLDTLIKA